MAPRTRRALPSAGCRAAWSLMTGAQYARAHATAYRPTEARTIAHSSTIRPYRARAAVSFDGGLLTGQVFRLVPTRSLKRPARACSSASVSFERAAVASPAVATRPSTVSRAAVILASSSRIEASRSTGASGSSSSERVYSSPATAFRSMATGSHANELFSPRLASTFRMVSSRRAAEALPASASRRNRSKA
ncbi:MAG: hypothetical protein A2177_11105 [Spirochaetes bacterium RBG_13_68_11]|nr:MAG: hypothetical protein A2177_11105 [Spirochaetes bacterium RBG_13_68_11]